MTVFISIASAHVCVYIYILIYLLFIDLFVDLLIDLFIVYLSINSYSYIIYLFIN